MTITINGTTGIAGVDGSASTPAVQGTDTNTGLFFGTDTVTIATGGTTAVTVDSGQRTKFLTTIGVGNATPATSGSGISFPATASASSDANTLDDYEEGTWTPVLQGSSTAGTYTYDTARTNGIYIKIGKMVTIFGCYRISAVTSAGSGDARITGLPFTSAVIGSSWNRSPGILGVQAGPTLTNNGYFCTTEGSTYLLMALQGVATYAAILVTDADFVDAIWFFQITYEVA